MSNAIEKQVKEVKLYTYAGKWNGSTDYEVEVGSYLPKSEDYRIIVPLSEVTVEIEIPAYDERQLLKAEVESLEALLLKEKADSHVRIVAIEEKIQSLLCIENQSDK